MDTTAVTKPKEQDTETVRSVGTWDSWLNRTKTVVEIVAIGIGGYWALTSFALKEAPLLGLRIATRAQLTWQEKTSDACIARYVASFKNIGTTSVDLTAARMRVWLLKGISEGAVAFLDPAAMREKNPIATYNLTNWLKGTYPADVANTVDFMFAMKRNPGRMVLFVLDGTSGEEKREWYILRTKKESSWYTYQFGYVCGEGKTAQAPNTTRPSSG